MTTTSLAKQDFKIKETLTRLGIKDINAGAVPVFNGWTPKAT